jgi:hypothetical protein
LDWAQTAHAQVYQPKATSLSSIQGWVMQIIAGGIFKKNARLTDATWYSIRDVIILITGRKIILETQTIYPVEQPQFASKTDQLKHDFNLWWEKVGGWETIRFALLMTLIFWIFAAFVAVPISLLDRVWGVQKVAMMPSATADDPYQLFHFVFPIWVKYIMIPFSLLPIELAVLIQFALYNITLALIIRQYGGTMRTVRLVLTSYFMFQLSMEVNIDWIIYIGLLVPPAFSAPFLLTKPQIAFGVWFGYPIRQIIYALIGMIVFLLITYLLWGTWAADMWAAIQRTTLRENYIEAANIAPVVFLPLPLSLLIGVVLAFFSFRRKDPILGIFAWLFFVPYMPLYSLVLFYALLAVKSWRAGLVIWLAMWIAFLLLVGYAMLR